MFDVEMLRTGEILTVYSVLRGDEGSGVWFLVYRDGWCYLDAALTIPAEEHQ